MELKLTNAEVMNLFGALNQLDLVGNAKFTYVIAKNRATLKPHVEALQESANRYAKTNPRVKEYQEKADALLKQFSTDEKGRPLTRQSADGQVLQRMIPPQKQQEYVMAREQLDAEYKDTLLGLDLHQSDFATLLREETTIPGIRTMSLKDIPDGGINTQIMNLIFVFVDDEKADVTPLKKVERPDAPSVA